MGWVSYDCRSPLWVLAGGQVEPIAILTYLTAYSNGGQFFNHRLRVYALSPRRGHSIDISSDGKLVEDVFWSQLGKDHSSQILPELTPTDLEAIANLDRMLRLECEAALKDEAGNWIGAIWPIAVSVLVPE